MQRAGCACATSVLNLHAHRQRLQLAAKDEQGVVRRRGELLGKDQVVPPYTHSPTRLLTSVHIHIRAHTHGHRCNQMNTADTTNQPLSTNKRANTTQGRRGRPGPRSDHASSDVKRIRRVADTTRPWSGARSAFPSARGSSLTRALQQTGGRGGLGQFETLNVGFRSGGMSGGVRGGRGEGTARGNCSRYLIGI